VLGTNGKPKRQNFPWFQSGFIGKVGVDEDLQTFRAKIEQLLTFVLLLLFRQAVL
jgi:hypothetical protein